MTLTLSGEAAVLSAPTSTSATITNTTEKIIPKRRLKAESESLSSRAAAGIVCVRQLFLRRK